MRDETHEGKTWPLLDYARWGFALCVVMIHVISILKWNAPLLLDYIISSSVPFFFISSGFLLGVKVNALAESRDRENALRKYGLRIGRMFLIWITIYAPLAICSYWFDPPKEPTLLRFLVVQIRSILLMGVEKYSWPTWYLYSLAIATFALLMNVKYKIPKILIMTIGALGILSLNLCSHNSEALGSTIVNLSLSFKNMTAGMLYVTLGLILSKAKKVKVKSYMIAAISLCASIVFYIADFPYWEGLAGLAVFVLLVQKESVHRDRIGVFASMQSIWVFLLHMYAVTIFFYFTDLPLLGPWYFWGASCLVVLFVSYFAVIAQIGDTRMASFLRRLT